MSSTSRSRQVFHLVLGCLLASGLGGCLGCGGEPVTLESTLRQRFPERAALVLEHGDAFVATEEGFALEGSSARGAWQGVEVTLPREGREAIGFRGFGGVEVRVREIGAEGEGTPAEHAIAYQRAGGTSFWTAMSGGVVEEWLHLDASAVRAGEAVAVWEVEGATVRQRGEGVEVVDASGVVRLSVTAPVAYAVGGREIGTRLVGSGATIELRVDAGGEAVLVDPVWTTASPMSVPRRDHTATRLAGGKVLVAGGYDSSGWTATAEIYDPVMNAWSPASPMSQIRGRHTATLLASGNVLVAGGFAGALYWYDNSEVPLASAELYDPTTDSWSLAGGLNQAREQHTMTLLPSGQVLLVGGHAVQNVRIAVAELYDPASNAWGLAGSLSTARVNHAAALLGSGKVLVAGGTAVLGGTTGYTATAELYDPSMNTWSPAASMIQARQSPIAARLGSDKVLVAGGSNGTALAAAELYDPVMNKWSLTAPMTQPRSDHAAILLGSGKMLTVGGQATGTYLPSAEAYDPGTGLWSAAGALTQGRMLPTMTVLGNGSILVAGGQNSAGSLASAQLYVTSSPLGNPCSLPSDCQSGFCADGVCCNTACAAGSCDACSTTAGAPVNGTCALLTGPACDDGDACTQSDACEVGVCAGANPVVCSAPDECHTGVCAQATGTCLSVAKPNGTPCDDGSVCTESDTCQAGACTGGSAMACTPQDSCHIDGDACDPVKGCPNTAKPDGAPCDDGSACTQSDTCQAGACTGGNPVVCAPLDTCHVPGKCDAPTGICTNLVKPDSAACDDGDACTQTDTCSAGVCKGANPVDCKAVDECHGAGTCDSKTGMCSTSTKPDGASCTGGTCNAGVCSSAPDVGNSSSSSSSSGGSADMNGGCGCGIVRTPDLHPAGWLGLGLLLVRRRRARGASSCRGSTLG